MSLGTTTWLFEKHEAPHGGAGPYTDLVHVKLIWHTSETAPGSLDGITRDMVDNQHTDTYHLAADPKLRKVHQYLPLNVAASALAHPASVETNHDGAVQVCVIGYAKDMANLSAADLRWLGIAVLAPIAKAVPELHMDIVATFYDQTAGFTLATKGARQRMAPAVWDNFNGQAGHQHVPGNDHWDPGRLNVQAISWNAHLVLDAQPLPPIPSVPKVRVEYMPNIDLPPIVSSMRAPDGAWLLGADGGVFGFPVGIRIHGSPVNEPLSPGEGWAKIRAPKPGEGPHYVCETTAGDAYNY